MREQQSITNDVKQSVYLETFVQKILKVSNYTIKYFDRTQYWQDAERFGCQFNEHENGYYNPFIEKTIFISDKLMSDRDLEMTIVHELTHLCQFEYKQFLCLGSDSRTALVFLPMDGCLNVSTDREEAYKRSLRECDATICSMYYLWYLLDKNVVTKNYFLNKSIKMMKYMDRSAMYTAINFLEKRYRKEHLAGREEYIDKFFVEQLKNTMDYVFE